MTRPTATEPVTLVFDKSYQSAKPVHYRKNDDLKMSGSAAFNERSLKEIAKPVKKKKDLLYVFDLRQESHGYLNDQPVTWEADRDWANAELNHEEVIRRERRLLGDLRIGEVVAGVTVKSIETEESLVRTNGHQYKRLTVTDHVRPIDSQVDRFIEDVRALPDQAWVHFHCRAGKGRTTTFMIMYDMLKNAKVHTFDQILERNQKLSDDYDVLKVVDESNWKHPYQKERAAFIRQFYDYAKAHPYGENALWSEWVSKNN